MFTSIEEAVITSDIQKYFTGEGMNYEPVNVFKKEDDRYVVVAKHTPTGRHAVWDYNRNYDVCVSGSYDLSYKEALTNAAERI